MFVISLLLLDLDVDPPSPHLLYSLRPFRIPVASRSPQTLLLADLPNRDTISTLVAKHIPPHILPARDTSGTSPPDESPHGPDLALAMRTAQDGCSYRASLLWSTRVPMWTMHPDTPK
ncbi:hypothetical protein CF319_g8673 [Tilletia indica]|nr:hypothetical protein CF319_g8673 [Tilletia indica]